jgi:hypothetical protein
VIVARIADEVAAAAGPRNDFFMANASYLRVTKSETRDLADRAYRARQLGEPEEWQMSGSAFLTAFVVIAALVALLALVLR